MSYVLAFLGFAALIILHEAGHFTAAKAVGMRVERFSLFFGPLLVKFRRGETEYGIGPIPLGGYVKITGMSPREQIPPDVLPRAYFNQPVWKRVVVILAGPAVNLVIAFAIAWGLFLSQGEAVPTGRQVIVATKAGSPAAGVLKPGDLLLSVDGVAATRASLPVQVGHDRCPGAQTPGCAARRPVRLTVRRGGHELTFRLVPHQDASTHRQLLGFEYTPEAHSIPVGAGRAASLATSGLWNITTRTVSTFAHIFQARERKQLHSVVGAYRATEASFAASTTQALDLLAVVSLSLAIINLFPFLPLDGGHVFWALAEKVRRRRIPFEVMERAGIVGFALILLVFAIGLSNDLSNLSGNPLNPR